MLNVKLTTHEGNVIISALSHAIDIYTERGLQPLSEDARAIMQKVSDELVKAESKRQKEIAERTANNPD